MKKKVWKGFFYMVVDDLSVVGANKKKSPVEISSGKLAKISSQGGKQSLGINVAIYNAYICILCTEIGLYRFVILPSSIVSNR